MLFGSDNVTGASPTVLQGLVAANAGVAAPYGQDTWCLQAEAALAEVFECDVKAFFVSSGTVANSLALSTLVPPWGAVLGQADAHIVRDESTAPELFTGGARVMALPATQGKLVPQVINALFQTPGHPPHHAVPAALSVTQINERGLVYTPAELSALAATARHYGLGVHMDGARFANAVAALGCAPADITWRAGVDVLSLGASKNGALMAEAVVFFKPDLARDFAYRLKRAGQVAAKSRYYGAQFLAWLANDHWLELAAHANHMAARLAAGIAGSGVARLAWPAPANEVFALLPQALAERLWQAGAVFHAWPSPLQADDPVPGPQELLVRLVTSFATSPDQVDTWLALLTQES